jgi:flavorubredoxin
MSGVYEAVKVTESVYWVGAIDWAIRDFHGYLTSRGTTYNAFLVLADKITLMDAVKAPFRDEMLSRIASVIEPGEIAFIVSNHSEMDHTGCLPEVIERTHPERVFASKAGVEAISEHFNRDLGLTAVKDGETISLGDKSLSFMESRMIHWPDSMVSYLKEEKVLFSQDAFGMHLASTERFADEIDDWVLEHEAAKYFANIVMPFSPLVLGFLKKVADAGLDISIIAPDHGPIWRKEPSRMVELYSKWADRRPGMKAVVVFDTMWQSTARMARAIGEGVAAGGASCKIMALHSSHRSDVATELLDAGALVVGSPTLNGNMFPTVADALTYLRGLKPRNLIGAAFGSFGWSGEAVKQIEEVLSAMKVELVGEAVRAKYVPDDETMDKCRALGLNISRRLRKVCEKAGTLPEAST